MARAARLLGSIALCMGALQPLTGAAQAPTPIATRALRTLQVPGYADFLVADGRGVWVTNEGRVERLVPEQGTPVASVAVPAPCGAMAIDFGALWVANCSDSTIYRIDLESRRVVARIRTGLADPDGELSVTTGAGSVWVLSDRRGVLSRIDPATNRVVATVAVAPGSFAAAFGFGAVWITNTEGTPTGPRGSVQCIDPATNRVVETIPTGPIPRFLAAGEGGVWTLNQGDGTVTRIDPSRRAVAATIVTGMAGTGGDIATGGGRVWVRGKPILMVAIDAATNRVTERFGPAAGSGGVRVADDLVWITAHDLRAVWVMRAR